MIRTLSILVACSSILGIFAKSDSILSNCYEDKKQKCNEGSGLDPWNTTVRFMLFTRKNPDEPELLHMCKGTLPLNTNFNPNNKLHVFIPGFLFGVCELPHITKTKDEWLESGDYNVILADPTIEYGYDFIYAVENTKKVADVVVKVIKNIQAKTGLKSEDIYLVGHSLGAQAAGMVGKTLKVHRITGLDPGGVLYTKDTPLDLRLDPSDADVVDVIHTNGGSGVPYLAASFPMGDADFYVNGGKNQPGCSSSAWQAVKRFEILYAFGMTTHPSICAHGMSTEYYSLSINNRYGKFFAWPCKSYKMFKSGQCTGKGAPNVTMGFDFEETFTPEQKERAFPRKYYLDTGDAYPYVNNSVSVPKQKSEPKIQDVYFISFFR